MIERRAFITLLSGMTIAWPMATRAQQKTMPVIGHLSSASPGPSASGLAAFRQGLSETGYVEGQDLTIEYRWAEGHYDRLPALAADLVGRKVDVIVVRGGVTPARAARNSTATIPIIFSSGSDPVEDGLITSLARPGSNLTGVIFLNVELIPKRLEMLQEIVPRAGVITLLVNSNNPVSEREVRIAQEAAGLRGLQVNILKASTEGEINTAFASLVQRQAGALVISTDPYFFDRRDQIVALAARHAVPAIYGFRECATAGGLISYGSNIAAVFRQVGISTGRILKGAKPADLPVEQPTKFEQVINMKTAKALGLTIPPSILARADEVIE